MESAASASPSMPAPLHMLDFLGPAQAAALAPLCDDRDLAAWAGVHPTAHAVLTADAVWRELVLARFRPALGRLGRAEAGGWPTRAAEPECESAEALVAQLPEGVPRQVYAAMRQTTAHPFALEPRARLLLEIHELKEWDRHKRSLILQRQAGHIAKALGRKQVVEKLHDDMAPLALELVSIQAMMGGTSLPRLLEDTEWQWGPSADSDLQQLMEKRLQRRRAWWQRQREFLLQDLGWN